MAAAFDCWRVPIDDPDPEPENSGPIEPNKPIDEIRQSWSIDSVLCYLKNFFSCFFLFLAPYALPDMFEWTDCDIQKEEEVPMCFQQQNVS